MAKKTNLYYESVKRIRAMMTEAGIYEARYELQIEQAADTMVEVSELRHIIKSEGRTLVEEKTGGIGIKRLPHPLLNYLNQCETRVTQLYAALGLNKLSEKKAETKAAKTASDPTADYFSAIR